MEKSSSIGDGDETAGRRDMFGSGPEPLAFAFWDVQGDIVRDNVARFVAGSGETVSCLEIGVGYEARMTQDLAAGRGPDVFYAQRAEASFWGATGAVLPLDEARFAPVLSRMDRRMVEGARDADGRLLGLTYYNGGPFALFAHKGFAGAGEQAFGSWDAVLDYLRRSKRDGIAEYPLLPRWHGSQTGLVWSLVCHLASEGVLGLEEEGAGTALTGVLEFFLALVEEELVPPQSLDDRGDGAALARWVSGRHVLSFTTDYLAMDAMRAVGEPVNVVLDLPGQAGTPLMPGHALLCLRTGIEGERLARAEHLLVYLGGPAVHERWLRECLFGVAYAELEQAPDMHEAMVSAFAAPYAERSLQRLIAARGAAVMSPMMQDPGMLGWTGLADVIIREKLLRRGACTPAEASEQLLAIWFSLAGD